MGFMAGFGPAFARGMEKNAEQREQRRDDAFKYAFSEYSKNNDKITDQNKETQKNVRKAKAMSEGNPDVWPKVYEWVSSGLSDKQIAAMIPGLSKGPAKSQTVAAPASTPDTPEAGSDEGGDPDESEDSGMGTDETVTGSITAQTQGAGLAPKPQPATQAAPAPEDKQVDEPGGFLSGLSGKFKGSTSKLPTREQAAPEDKMVADPEAAPQAAPAPAPQGGGGMLSGITGNNFLRDSFGNGSGSMPRFMDEAAGNIGQMTGRSPQEVQAIMRGQGGSSEPEFDTSGITYTPPVAAIEPDKINTMDKAMIERTAAYRSGNPERIQQADDRVNALKESILYKEETRAMADKRSLPGDPVNLWKDGKYLRQERVQADENGVLRGFDGQPLEEGVRTTEVSPQERDDKQKVIEKLDKPMQEYNTKADNYIGMVRGVGELNELYKENPEALLKVVPSAATWLDRLSKEGQGVINVFNKESDLPVSWESINQLEKQAEGLSAKVNTKGVQDLAATAALAETKKAIIVYRLGMAMGQSGRNLAEAERKIFGNVIEAGTSLPVWQKNMSGLLESQKFQVDMEGRSIAASPLHDGFFDDWGHRIPALTPKSLDERMSTMMDDPYMKSGVDLMNQEKLGQTTNPRDKLDQKLGTGQPASEAPTGPAQRQPVAQPQVREGATATNPQTGEKRVFKQGQWVAVQ